MNPSPTSRITPWMLALAAAAMLPASAHAQSVQLTGGGADLTFYYHSPTDTWDTVLRAKGDTVATGLTQQANQSRFGSAAGDWSFSSLNVQVSEPARIDLNARSYYVTPILSLNPSSPDPDLGLRTRLREDASTDQFTRVTLSLDLSQSVMPAGADVALFTPGSFGDFNVRLETASGKTSTEWEVWGHSHWHWGFSEPGDYSLAFNIQGERADASLSSIGSTTVGFQVVPEPSALALLGFGMGAGWLLLRRRSH
jgi:surface-anchored protein